MKIIQNILTKNPCYKSGKKIEVKGLMLHSVGCPQPDANTFIRSWNKSSYKNACVHGFIDGNSGVIYQTLPWNHRGWHCGGTGNNTHIGIEMCEPSSICYISGSRFICSNEAEAKAIAKRTYDSAVELFAYLCKKYNLNPLGDGVILSHREGYQRKIATNHGDPEHLWIGLKMDYSMDGFRKAVWTSLNKENNIFKDNKKKNTEEYLVKIKIPNLNIRSGAGTNYSKTGKYTGKGTFTIISESEGKGASKWGKLKSGAGWISLDYAEKIS